MMVQRYQHKTREYRGPAPQEVAIVARPPRKTAPDAHLQEMRKAEASWRERVKDVEKARFADVKNDWELLSNKRLQVNTIKRRVTGMLQQQEFDLEDRRERLRNLLLSEEKNYIAEMEAKEETVIERQAKMRERAKELKEKRELERLAVVEEKLDQRWRNQCEELRSTLSKRQQDEVAAERLEQLRFKSLQEEEKEMEEKMFADLWHEDMMAKAQREENDARKQHEKNKEVLAYLKMQMAALDQQKLEAERLKEEEAQLLREQAALREIEERKAREEKERKQAETRQMYDLSLRMKMKKKAKEVQEQLAFDMKILEQLLEESRNEALEQEKRKKELREEDQRYRQYLQAMLEEEKLREKELDRIIDAEVEAMWQKRLKQWRLEKQARQKLLQDVLATRQQQVYDKLRINEVKQEEARRERENILRVIEENKRLEKEQQKKIWEKNHQYQSDLVGQIGYTQRLREEDLLEEQREWVKGQEAELEYQRRLKDALDRPHIDNVHPIRRRRSGRRAQRSQMADILG